MSKSIVELAHDVMVSDLPSNHPAIDLAAAVLEEREAEDPFTLPTAPSPTSCCYCGVTLPYAKAWVEVGHKQVSCGGPDCVAF
jgi:hypothetical protein